MFRSLEPAPAHNQRPRCLARVRLLSERFVTELDGVEREVELPALSLTFDYGGTELRASDQRHRFFAFMDEGVKEIERDQSEERRVQCLVESFGAVEIDQAIDFSAPIDSPADYIIQPTGNVHSWCSFSVHAVQQLKDAGCVVTYSDDYTYRVIEDDPLWVAAVESESEKTDWFGLKLGILVDEQRVDVLPMLLELLESHPDGRSLDSFLGMPSMRVALPVGKRRYVTLPPERLRALLRVLLELYRGDRLIDGKLRFLGAQANSLCHLQEALKIGNSELIFEGVRDVVVRGQTSGASRAACGRTCVPGGPRGEASVLST